MAASVAGVQIAYLSARPALFHETLEYVRHHLGFIDDIVVVTPSGLAHQMAGDDITVLTDEDVLGDRHAAVTGSDHTTRNYHLRVAMAAHDALADEFVMSDDDARPLRTCGPDIFRIGERTRNYFFYELDAWGRDETPFDQGLTHALLVLRQAGIPRPLAYASHHPQLIDKALFVETTGRYSAAAEKYPLDEWSIYFNTARDVAPERFAEPEAFVTLGWPQFSGEWPHQIAPADYLFENHHPELYADDGLFAGLPSMLDIDGAEAHALEKAARWHRFGLAVQRLEFPDDVANPWTQGKASRKLFFRGTRAVKKVVDYATIDDRTALVELEGRVRRLEDRLDGQSEPS